MPHTQSDTAFRIYAPFGQRQERSTDQHEGMLTELVILTYRAYLPFDCRIE